MMRISGVGNILGYFAGGANLPEALPWLGDSQFKVLCAIAALVIAVTVGISCSTIHERDPRFDNNPETQEGVIAFFKSLYRSVRSQPPQIRNVCEVQFFAWLGWFPFLFYISTYVGEIYTEPYFEKNPNMSEEQIDQLWEEATRIGTRALLIFAITTFALSIVLPFIIPPTYEAPNPNSLATSRTPMAPMAPGGSVSRAEYFGLKSPEKHAQKPVTSRIMDCLALLQIRSLTLRRSWAFSHILFAFLMAMTFFVRDTLTATILVACIGIPWTFTSWAPFALISSEISKREAIRRGLFRPTDRDAALIAAGEDDASAQGADQAGVVLGIHNVAVAAPQGVATLVSSIMFKFLQKPRGTPGDHSTAWVLRVGGCCAVVAAWLTLRINEERGDADTVRSRRRRAS
jgi:solute carrier family 45 protein 1/2/4